MGAGGMVGRVEADRRTQTAKPPLHFRNLTGRNTHNDFEAIAPYCLGLRMIFAANELHYRRNPKM